MQTLRLDDEGAGMILRSLLFVPADSEKKLANVAHTASALGALLGARQRRQQQRRQDGNDRDDYQQLNQGEGKLPSRLAGSQCGNRLHG